MPSEQRLLVIENSIFMINFLVKTFERRFLVTCENSLEKACTNVDLKDSHLVVIDFRLIQEDEKSFQDFLKKHPKIPIIVISSAGEKEDLEAKHPKANLYFATKPAQQNQLMFLTKKVLKTSKIPIAPIDDMLLPQSVLIVEDDKFITKMIDDALRAQGVERVDCTYDGKTAWEEAQAHKYDFIILDWVIPTYSGLNLFNRFRQSRLHATTPILVVSGFVDKKDFSILSDCPLADIFEKPFQSSALVQQVTTLYKEAIWHDESEGKLYQFFDSLKTNTNSLEAIQKFIASSPRPYFFALIAGRILKHQQKYSDAEALLQHALKSKENQLMALNELGKLYIEQGRNKEAKTIMRRASLISPDNIERLCNLGDISLQEMDIHSANEYFKKAKSINSEDKKSLSGRKLVHNIALWMRGGEAIPKTYAALLNSIGITLLRSGEFEKGIEHYKSALLHIEDTISRSKLAFNLGLGYTKWNQPQTGLDWFRKALELNKDYEKAQKYVKQIEDRLGPSQSRTNPAPTNPDDADFILLQDTEDDQFFDIPQSLQGNSKKILEELRRACIRVDEYLALLDREGIYAEGQIPLLQKLMNNYGRETFSQAINIAIEGQITSVLGISNILSKKFDNFEED